LQSAYVVSRFHGKVEPLTDTLLPVRYAFGFFAPPRS
jgi:hypothetical protein